MNDDYILVLSEYDGEEENLLLLPFDSEEEAIFYGENYENAIFWYVGKTVAKKIID